MMAEAISSESVGFFDADESMKCAAVREKWMVAEKAALLEGAKPLGELAASRLKALYPLAECDCDGGAVQVEPAEQPFLSVADREALNSALRHRRIERAKEILEIHRRVQLHGFVGEGDLSFDATAERLADLIFGERTNGGH